MPTWTPSSGYDPRSELLPNIFDHYAQVKPEAIYAEYPVNPMTYEEGYRLITYKALANAINGVAGWLTKTLGPGTGETLAYLGPNDLRYPALVLGAVKAGYCMFLTSPRNSAVAHQSLFIKLGCTTLLAPSPRPPFIAGIVDAHSVKVVDVPSMAELLATQYPVFPYHKTYPEAAHDRLVILHTSGSTGIPKPIIWTHDSAVKHMHMQRLDIPAGCEGQDSWGFGKRMYLSLPPFHAAGLGHILFITMPVDTTRIMPTAAGLPSATGMVAARKQTPFDWAVVVPSIVLELSQSADLLEYCGNHLEYMMYCGGDLPQPVGDIVSRKLRIVNGYGASELGILNVIHDMGKWDPLKDWRYLHFHPQLGVEFRHVSGDEYEAVMVRTPEREGHQFPFSIFPDRQEYHTNDLMVPHPDPAKSDLWRPSARLDDVIVFLNGEKTNPVSMEGHILASNPEVTGALVAGAQRFQAALIIELGRSEVGLSTSHRAAAIERLWPSRQQANEECPAHARIAKSHILFTTPEKPMLRAGKGTVQRAGTLAMYAAELDALYADAEKLAQHDAGENPGPGAVDDVVKVAAFIRASLLAITGWSAEKVSDTESWLTLGMDSLQALTITRVLKQGLLLPTLTPNLIYLHPSITELTEAVQQLDMQGKQSTETHQQGLVQERDELLQRFIGHIEKPNPATIFTANRTIPATQTVILTGSTGQLGTYILDALLRDSSVAHVHCLNRGDHARERQHNRIKEYGLTPLADNEGRLSFWTADLSQEGDLGLQPDVYTQLQQTATLIIHNAWTVNFNLPLATFKPHMQGVVNLINFATCSPQAPHLFFLSSISSVMGHRTSESGLLPEIVITTTTPAPNGYANSKYIAEHLLDYAVKQQQEQQSDPKQTRAAPSFSFARVGQVAGAVRSPGLWNRAEWLSPIPWVPVDLLAEVLVELALLGVADDHGCSSATGSPRAVQVYHPINLEPQSWDLMRPVVADTLLAQGKDNTEKTIETIPLHEWVQRVRRDIEAASVSFSADTKDGKGLGGKELQALLEQNPAAKLLDFFEGLETEHTQPIVFESVHTAKMSKKLREVKGVRPGWLGKWIREWLA
ncbi:NRPS-like enzyme [Aspergillus piperis CBS 112811]|uniref:NRPS-like enzyme n=1 Tax=Aspergillus piperis CBS 112811 TaxID=1448313 RepID=A0A8G1QWW9_9EURO|nr:NRPS-like enzyme [Aspergillus piperis CBS 112811]RAH54357.1 NRPS-like enzyme [Aspergillus piperis CBS 112811]